MAQGFKILKPG